MTAAAGTAARGPPCLSRQPSRAGRRWWSPSLARRWRTQQPRHLFEGSSSARGAEWHSARRGLAILGRLKRIEGRGFEIDALGIVGVVSGPHASNGRRSKRP